MKIPERHGSLDGYHVGSLSSIWSDSPDISLPDTINMINKGSNVDLQHALRFNLEHSVTSLKGCTIICFFPWLSSMGTTLWFLLLIGSTQVYMCNIHLIFTLILHVTYIKVYEYTLHFVHWKYVILFYISFFFTIHPTMLIALVI